MTRNACSRKCNEDTLYEVHKSAITDHNKPEEVAQETRVKAKLLDMEESQVYGHGKDEDQIDKHGTEETL